jgi:transcriptional regulator with XRE-family HTH domain
MVITLKAARVNKNLSQTEAAKLLNIAVCTLISYEKGYTFPNVETIKKMESLYDVDFRDITFLPKNNG